MRSTIPSHETYVVDVPEVKDLRATFQYNFFVADEGSNETGAVPARFLMKGGEQFDASTVDVMRTRVPRFVELCFTPINAAVGHSSQDEEMQARTRRAGRPRVRLISENLDKIVTEDHFASQGFVALTFQDARPDERAHSFVSGAYVQQTLSSPGSTDTSAYRAGLRLAETMPNDVNPSALSAAMARQDVQGIVLPRGQNARQDPARVNVAIQVNSKVLHDMVTRGMADPSGHFVDELRTVAPAAKRAQNAARAAFTPDLHDEDYQSLVPYVSIKFGAAAQMPIGRPAEVIGYVIDRTERLSDGSTRVRPPIVIDDASIGRTFDLRIRYGASYTYTLRAIARFTFSAIDVDTGQVALVSCLVSSRASNPATITCTETQAPPPPADVGFTWNHETERLMVRWAFPTNPQRDIKRFQVFRRGSIEEPFQLVKAFDFDDSTVPIKQREQPAPELVERTTSPRTSFIDTEFDRASSFVYAVGCVDAHANVSPYSAQFRVSFDRFKNRLRLELVSHLGAPRQYPNMYLEADTFIDSIADEGHRALRLYFTPECYDVVDDDGRVSPAVVTMRDGGSYRLQFINPDAQKMSIVSVNVDDRRQTA